MVEHRGAAAEAGEAEMKTAESPAEQGTKVSVTREAEANVLTETELFAAQMETAMAPSLEPVVPDGRRMAQVRATEVAEHYEAQRETERTESARALAERLNAQNAAGIAARAAGAVIIQRAERLLSPTDILEQERLLQQAAQAMKDRKVTEYGLRRRQVSTEEQDQLARALAESQADAEGQRLAQEEERRVIQAAIDETGLDAEVRKADEDKVTAAVSESRRNADTLEAVETAEAIQRTWNEDPEMVVQMQAQVAGLPTQDTEVFKENIERSGMEEFSTPSNGDCFYHVVEDNTEGSAVSLGMTADGLRKHSAAEAMKRGEIDQEEADRRSVQGQLVAGEEIQSMATTLGCRMVIYHARPAPGEPDKDTIEPEGRAAVRDICMVLRSAHYTVLSDPDCYQRKMTTRQRRQRQTDMDGDKRRAEHLVPFSRRRQRQTDMDRDKLRADHPTTVEPRRPEITETEPLVDGPSRHSGFAMRAVPARVAGLGYAEENDYSRLTRKQRKEATRFTHQYDEVGITTRPKGMGMSQGVEQMGSSGVTASRGTAGGEMHPFNQTALHMRSAERSRRAKAANELAKQREYGSGASMYICTTATSDTFRESTYRCTPVPDPYLPPLSVQQALRRGVATWAMKEVGQEPG